MSKEQLDPELEKYLHIDFPPFVLTQEAIDAMKGNPNAPVRQRMGLVRNNEQDKQYREEALKRPLP